MECGVKTAPGGRLLAEMAMAWPCGSEAQISKANSDSASARFLNVDSNTGAATARDAMAASNSTPVAKTCLVVGFIYSLPSLSVFFVASAGIPNPARSDPCMSALSLCILFTRWERQYWVAVEYFSRPPAMALAASPLLHGAPEKFRVESPGVSQVGETGLKQGKHGRRADHKRISLHHIKISDCPGPSNQIESALAVELVQS